VVGVVVVAVVVLAVVVAALVVVVAALVVVVAALVVVVAALVVVVAALVVVVAALVVVVGLVVVVVVGAGFEWHELPGHGPFAAARGVTKTAVAAPRQSSVRNEKAAVSFDMAAALQ
jgi:hypothetical protein